MAKQGFLWYRSNLLLLLGFTCLSYNSNMQQLNSFVKDPSSNGISSRSPIKKLWFFTKISTIPLMNFPLIHSMIHFKGTATSTWVLTCPYLLLFYNKQQDNKNWTKLNNKDLPTKFFSKNVCSGIPTILLDEPQFHSPSICESEDVWQKS